MNVGVAALVAANACDLVNIGQVAVLARAVDRSSGGQETLIGYLPMTGEELRFELDELDEFQVVG